MPRPLDKEAKEAERTSDDDRPGRVEFDSRGNSVWRWARDVIESTSVLLKRLENKDLALEPTQKVPVIGANREPKSTKSSQPARSSRAPQAKTPGSAPKPGGHKNLGPTEKRGDGGGGFDPYNSR